MECVRSGGVMGESERLGMLTDEVGTPRLENALSPVTSMRAGGEVGDSPRVVAAPVVGGRRSAGREEEMAREVEAAVNWFECALCGECMLVTC